MEDTKTVSGIKLILNECNAKLSRNRITSIWRDDDDDWQDDYGDWWRDDGHDDDAPNTDDW